MLGPLQPIDDGLICHVIHRGNNPQDVFHETEYFRRELELSSFAPSRNAGLVRTSHKRT